MMINIAKDTPSELINLARKVNFSAIPKEQHNEKIIQLRNLAERYGIPKRTHKPEAASLDLGDCPQALATLVSQMDFSRYNKITRTVAISFMENWLRNNKLIKV